MSNSKVRYDTDATKAKKKTTIRHKQHLEEEWLKEQEEELEQLIIEDQLGDKSEIAHN